LTKLFALLEDLHVPVGGLVYLHTSFSRMAALELTPSQFIEGLLDYLGPEGTLTMPSFSWNIDGGQRPWKGYADYFRGDQVFDVVNTSANIGAVPETFRQRSGVLRGVNYWWSVAACGPLAETLTEAQDAVEHPAGPGSSFARIHQHGGFLLGLGVTLNTTSLAFLPDYELNNQAFVTSEPRRGLVVDRQGRTKDTWSYWVRPESVRYVKPERVFSTPLQGMRLREGDGVIQFAYPYRSYHQQAVRLGREAQAQGRPSPWWEELP